MTSQTAATSLELHLRRRTRQWTQALPEAELLDLARDLLDALAEAQRAVPPRHPSLDPTDVVRAPEGLRFEQAAAGPGAEDMLSAGSLLLALALGAPAAPSWRLDPPPLPRGLSLGTRGLLAGLVEPRLALRFADARAARATLDPPGPAAWPLFHGGPWRTGETAGWADATRLQRRWELPTADPVGSPVLVGGLVLAAEVWSGRLLFVDARTGRLLHTAEAGGAAFGAPAISGDTVLVGTDAGELVAFDLTRGEERGRIAIGLEVRSSPLVVGDDVVLGTTEPEKAGSVVSVDAREGRIRWRHPLPAPVHSSATLAGDRIVVGCDDGSVYAFARDSGTPVWKRALTGKVRATPAVSGGLVFVGDFAGRLVALHAADGETAWTQDLHAMYSSPAVAGGLVVVGCHDGHVHGVDAATGAPRFALAAQGPVISSAALGTSRCVVTSAAGELLLVDDQGARLDSLALQASDVPASPAASGSQVFVGSGGGLVAAVLAP